MKRFEVGPTEISFFKKNRLNQIEDEMGMSIKKEISRCKWIQVLCEEVPNFSF